MHTARCAAAALLILAGCSSGDDAGPATTNSDLRPADEVREDELEADGDGVTWADFGATVEIGAATATLAAPVPAGTDDPEANGETWTLLDIDARVENPTGDTIDGMWFTLRCEEGGEDTTTYYGWNEGKPDKFPNNGDQLPAGSFEEGVITIGVPPGCADPHVWTNFVVTIDGVTPRVAWRIPADALA